MLSEQEILKDIPLYISKSRISTMGNNTGSWRFVRPGYDEKTAPCSSTCPAGEDIARIEMLAGKGGFFQAWETIIIENPFPAVCGRVCFHTCEQACNRRELDFGLAIHNIERLVGDTAIRENYQVPPGLFKKGSINKHIAIAGAGPSGLSAAWFLSMLGYSCDIFETENEPGGVLRWGIPSYRLPRDILKYEINRITGLNFKDQNIKIFCNKTLTKDLIKKGLGYDAVFMGCGYGKSLKMGIPGEEKAVDGLEFLHDPEQSRDNTGKITAVIGGGNTAIDVARSLIRTGARPVIVYRRRKQDMPAFAHEVEMAVEEGIEIRELLAPLSIEEKNGKHILKLQKMKTLDMDTKTGRARVVPDGDKIETLEADRIFTAIGAEPGKNWYLPPEKQDNLIKLPRCTFQAEELPIIFGGDLASPVKSVTDAIASGKEAAIALDIYFSQGQDKINEQINNCRVGNGSSVSMEIYLKGERRKRSSHVVLFQEINTDYFPEIKKQEPGILFPDQRAKSFEEVEQGYDREAGIKEALRCFNCGICNDCDNCRVFCPDAAVMVNETRYINLDYCKGCGICVVECPRNAMSLEEEKI
ncbi:FAD/NAD(P)-binding domain-containing protein [Desulfonema limicola]|uniref:FAD/NAD(P)-binding domain-containing protein n=1 Tax=Desulfonema limicola TaxID=45656 RepID=A0A975GFY3_9BACT|nr:FAD-dependent oxidoreductase [Desulfonema limicola]QTA79650.1 FAD/NAD(P)-binding domain-containing protein [Desulfonema limicola]